MQKLIHQLKKKETYKIWILQFLIFMLGAYVVNKLSGQTELFGTQSIIWWVAFFALGIIELIVIAKSNIKKEEDLRKKSRMAYLHFNSIEKLSQQITLSRQFYKAEDYFKLLLSHLRTDTEIKKFEKINRSHSVNWVLSSLSMWDYFISIFRSLINELIEKDEYLTLSIIDFWSKDKDSQTIAIEHGVKNNDSAKNFFESNFLKCAKANVSSKRIIIVNVDRLKKGKVEKEGDNRNYYLAFTQILSKYNNEAFEHKLFYNCFYLVEDSVYGELVKEDIPFALVRREGYEDKLCVSTYIPDLHTQELSADSKDSWRKGNVPKIGMHIAPNENDEIWTRLYGKFKTIYNNKSGSKHGKYFTPEELKIQLDAVLN